jgi:hypothetical protein
VVVIFLATRIPLFLLGCLATYLLASGDAVQRGNLRYAPEAPRALRIWVHWDADWYLLIADRGYDALEAEPSLAPRNSPDDTAGFFPLFPWLVRALSLVTGGSVLAGLLVSNLALLCFLFLLYSWTASRCGDAAGRGACVAVCTFPTSLFLSAPYSESLFLALAVGCLVAARAERGALAAIAGFAAALTRPLGVLLSLPMIWRALDRSPAVGARRTRWLTSLGPPLGLGAFLLFCAWRFADPLATLARQARWRGGMGPPWTFLVEAMRDLNPHGRVGSIVDLTVALLAIALLPAVFRRLGTGAGLFATASVLLPLSSGLFSFSRLVLGAFPLFAVLGCWWAEREAFRLAYLAAALPFAGLFVALYATGWWVG